MVPRQDLFAAFSVARRLQHEVGIKSKQIGILKDKLEWSEKTRAGLEKEISKLFNTFEIVFSGSITDLKKLLKEYDVSDFSKGQAESVFPCSLKPLNTMELLSAAVSHWF
jgi:hypothetical protein